MSIFYLMGIGYTVFCTALATVWIAYSVYQHTKRTLELSLRGEVEQQRDIVEAARVRGALEVQ